VLKLVLPKGSLEKATFDLFDAADLTVMRSSSVDYKATIDDPRIDEVRNHGLKHFIQKPFTYEILANTVWEVLNEDKLYKSKITC
jgi:hypothetical protein